MPQRERIGVHYHNATPALPAERTEILTVLFQPPSLFHQKGLGSACQYMEAQTLKHRLILRLGEQLELRHAPGRSQGDEMGHQRRNKAFGTGLLRNGNALDNIPVKTGAG